MGRRAVRTASGAGRRTPISAQSFSPAICSTRSTMRRRSFGILDAHERLGQRKALGGREEVGHIGRRGRFPHAVRTCRSRSARLRRRTTPAPAGCAKSAAAGWRRSGWCPSRISALAETSARARRRASPGSCSASCGASAPGCPRACRWGSGPFWPLSTRSPIMNRYSAVAGRNVQRLTTKCNPCATYRASL